MVGFLHHSEPRWFADSNHGGPSQSRADASAEVLHHTGDQWSSSPRALPTEPAESNVHSAPPLTMEVPERRIKERLRIPGPEGCARCGSTPPAPIKSSPTVPEAFARVGATDPPPGTPSIEEQPLQWAARDGSENEGNPPFNSLVRCSSQSRSRRLWYPSASPGNWRGGAGPGS